MKKFKNLTPHAIVLNDGTTYASEGLARVSSTFTDINDDGVCEQQFGEIVGLPKPEKDVLYIVSALVLAAAEQQGRTDCVAPATGHPECVRDEQGHIVSVPCFVKSAHVERGCPVYGRCIL